MLAANPDGQTPAFILGLNEDGGAVSKIYMRSALAQSTITSGTDTTIWDIANGVSMGTINYGQWNHFAVTRKVMYLELLKMVQKFLNLLLQSYNKKYKRWYFKIFNWSFTRFRLF